MKYIKKSTKYIIAFICMVIIFFSALYLTALIPRELIFNNLSKSAEILKEEGGSYLYYVNNRGIQIDNYTDAIMLNTIYSIDSENIAESIIKCRRNYNLEITTEIYGEKLGNLTNEDGSFNPVQDLEDTINKRDLASHEYARYWHGYMSIIRPMLIFFNITQIRIIFEVILCVSLFILSVYLYNNVNKIVAILAILTFMAMDILSFIQNVQGVLVMIIAVITAIFIANHKINKKNISIILFIVGGMTSYFDFLTTPLITILFPAIIYFVVNKQEDLKDAIKKICLMSIVWGLGYIGIWFSKWVINDWAYNSNLILSSLEQILFRISSNEIVGTKNIPLKSVKFNIFNSINITSVSILIISIIYAIKNYKNCFKKYKIIYVLIGIIPILWYLIIANHSCQHFFYTYKLLVVTLFAIMCISFDNENELVRQNKIIVAIIIIFINIFFIFSVLNYLNHLSNNRDEEVFDTAIMIADEKIEEESAIYNNLIKEEYENQAYSNPYIFDGFSYVEGTWQNGFVIQDEQGNQYVWVPCTNKNLSEVENLERINNSNDPFIDYMSCYNESYENFLKSALQNGGFYISRYEIGKEQDKFVSKSDVELVENVTKSEAENIVSQMYNNVNCEIINGYAYDTTLIWLEKCSSEKSVVEVKENEKIHSGRNKINNIYDFCDNVLEYSLENLYDTIIVRGFINSDGEFSKESRFCMPIEDSKFGGRFPVAIRTIIYK